MRIADLAKELKVTEKFLLERIKTLKLRSKDGLEITAGVEFILRDALADEGIGKKVVEEEAPKKVVKKASTADLGLVEALKRWRLAVAKKEGVPAFRVLTDAVLREIAESRPESEEELLEIAGIGPRLASRYGAGILSVLAGTPLR